MTPDAAAPERDDMETTDTWLKPSEIAAELRVNRNTVYRLIEGGLLPATKVSRNLFRVRRRDLDAYLASGGAAS